MLALPPRTLPPDDVVDGCGTHKKAISLGLNQACVSCQLLEEVRPSLALSDHAVFLGPARSLLMRAYSADVRSRVVPTRVCPHRWMENQ